MSVDPSRAALAALDRIKSALIRAGHSDRIGEAISARELAARADVLGQQLPASYVAMLRVAATIGDPEDFLDAARMQAVGAEIHAAGLHATRYIPFCLADERPVCFDRKVQLADGELPVCVWGRGYATPVARNFGEWLDIVADEREERMNHAADIPPRLKRLLLDLGFEFRFPVLGRLETADTLGIETLIGVERAREIRGNTGKLFDSTGRAHVLLNLEDFSASARLRTTVVELAAEDVFRWLRSFRDENFFGDIPKAPSHPDSVRDLRKAPREIPLIVKGSVELARLPAKNHVFVAATGRKPDDFYLLGRSTSKRESLVLRVEDGVVTTARVVPDELQRLHVTGGGHLWGLSTTHAFRFDGPSSERFPLSRPTEGPIFWRGIGGSGERVFVWGAGALLQFDGSGFLPFAVDMGLDPQETVLSVRTAGEEIAALIVRDGMGAVARFDGDGWAGVSEQQVLSGELVDLDIVGGAATVLDSKGATYTYQGAGAPSRRPAEITAPALRDASGAERKFRGMVALEGVLLFASNGGFLTLVPNTEPLFHTAFDLRSGEKPGSALDARLDRVGASSAVSLRPSKFINEDEPTGVVGTCGPCAWSWHRDAFSAIDLRAW
ncbi:MAG: hypothetical protein U0174_17715 [Polyangiaceae bacterium]